MSKKKQIYNKLKILISREFEDPQKAFEFFDKDHDGKLERAELKGLLKKAGVSSFLRGIVASKMVDALDNSDDSKISWKEFKKVAKELMEDETLG
ncbi:MAG: EF-hand domain-containing protein [Bacteroidota bacterium]